MIRALRSEYFFDTRPIKPYTTTVTLAIYISPTACSYNQLKYKKTQTESSLGTEYCEPLKADFSMTLYGE